MNGAAFALGRLDRLIWTMVAIVGAVVLAVPAVSDFRIEWQTFMAPALACAALLAGGWFYRTRRTDPRLASGLTSTAQVIAFAAVGAPLSYAAASLSAGVGLPLQDHAFDSIDRALGLDWRAMLAWMNNSPAVFAVLRPIYLSLTPQMTTAVLCLAFSGRLVWLRVFILAFMLAALSSIAVSVVLPAVGAWPYYELLTDDAPNVLPTVSTSWPVFHGLREGTLRTLVAAGSEGIITFPSLHAALAVILIAALWPVAVLRWVILALNTVMLIATPIDGSHYFVDVFAGIAIAALSLLGARAIAAVQQRVPAAQTMGDVPSLATRE